jgi:predicted nucleic acid-binding protein
LIVVDASVWISSWLADDVNHLASDAWLERQVRAAEQITVPALFLAEVGGAIARRTGDVRSAQQAVDDILDSGLVRLISVDEGLARAAAGLAVRLRLRGSDATYVATAQRFGIPLVTWDREQRERAAAVIETLTPAES